MHELDRSQSVHSEAAILVRVTLEDDRVLGDPLEELQGLAETAGAEVVGRLVQRRGKPDMTTYLGKGKVEELKFLVDAHDADLVVFDNDLSPAQIRNLERALEVKVLDRTELILDIFATHAQTFESRLAVELAQLEYSLPRLKRMWTHLSRIKHGVGMRGPGEKQLEEDRRLVEKRISDLKRELKTIEDRKERQVSGRRSHRTVSLVGYTNAGKSTLMNQLTDAKVLAEDKLFATLDTRTRRWQLPNWGPVLLSDTVGFIRDLPHALIASFKATLEEARQADLLLHVADASNPAVYDQIAAVYLVLKEMGIEEKDTLLVLNKIDQIENLQRLDGILNRYPNAVPISAFTGLGLERLAGQVSDALSRGFVEVEIETAIDNGKLLAYLAEHGEVFSRRFDDTHMVIHCRLPEKNLGRIDPKTVVVRPYVSDDAEVEEDDPVLAELLAAERARAVTNEDAAAEDAVPQDTAEDVMTDEADAANPDQDEHVA
ncbi:GTPase HflX [Lignipirellula cremea]|uniref:GTPase HflX n=1 Tax=Lignipirellula cremea TaxID=2528010 RepID=A0A518DPA6_9BACT|nr:GTPase HflX [Lignipirellula cremea]QDU93671.1 GTPase HflX [Lignipirellula cremea]